MVKDGGLTVDFNSLAKCRYTGGDRWTPTQSERFDPVPLCLRESLLKSSYHTNVSQGVADIASLEDLFTRKSMTV